MFNAHIEEHEKKWSNLQVSKTKNQDLDCKQASYFTKKGYL